MRDVIVNVEVDIARPRDQVFDLMADARNELAWNSRVTKSDLVSGEPIGKGTEFATTNRDQKYVAFDSAGGTRMTAQFDLTPKGFMKVMLPLMSGPIRKDFPRQLAWFKEFCESSS